MHVSAVTLSRQCSHMVAAPVCSAASPIVAKTTIEIDEDGEKEIQMTDVQSDGQENAKIVMRGTEQRLFGNLGGVRQRQRWQRRSDRKRPDQRDDDVLAGVNLNSLWRCTERMHQKREDYQETELRHHKSW